MSGNFHVSMVSLLLVCLIKTLVVSHIVGTIEKPCSEGIQVVVGVGSNSSAS